MKAIILTPYGEYTAEIGTFKAPVLMMEYPVEASDLTGHPLTNGIPAINLMVMEADVTGQQLAAIKSDNRFFVLSPGPGNTGNALTTWLSGKGVNGHGVTNSDTAEEATAKLREHFRTAP